MWGGSEFFQQISFKMQPWLCPPRQSCSPHKTFSTKVFTYSNQKLGYTNIHKEYD